MNEDNRALAELLKKEFLLERTNRLVKIESERKLSEKLGIGRQRIREVIHQLISEGVLVKNEGKGTYIAPLIKSKNLNLICSPNIKSNDPFYNNLFMELTSYAAKNSVRIISLRMDTLRYGKFNSPLLLIGRFEEEDLSVLKSLFEKVISFENYPEHDDFAQIYFDHFKIGQTAAKILAEHGHRKVIHITGPDKFASAHFRKTGFVKGARKNELDVIVLNGKMNFEGGYSLGPEVEELISQGYSAVFAANDWMAIGLIQALKEKNIKVPGQLSTLSVDNIPLSSQIYPDLTTFALDVSMMIAECFVLIDLAETDEGATNFNKRIILQPVLISRKSLISYSE